MDRAVRIALIDYGAGNLASVRKALAAYGAEVYVPAAPGDLGHASAVVVPGVGHFGATAALDAAWRSAIAAGVERGRPLLGVCLGLQWLFEGSDEAPDVPGLGLLEGRSVRLGTTQGPRLKVPHVGWNALRFLRPGRLTRGVADGSYVYFTHSFAAPLTADTVAATSHGRDFTSIVEHPPVFGVQFHPEKSSEVGLVVIEHFVAIAREAWNAHRRS